MARRDKRNWRNEDKEALVSGTHDQAGIMDNMRELVERTNDRRSLEIIEDTHERARRTHSGLSGIIRRLFGRM